MDYTQAGQDSLSHKKILITGGSGFIGGSLIRSLCDKGAEVHSTSREFRVSNIKNLKWWQGSFENFEEAEKIYRAVKPDFIFHLAGNVTTDNRLAQVLSTYHSLLTSTVNLLTIATQVGCDRIILTGSSTEPLDSNPNPNSPYAAVKWATTAYGKLFKSLYDTPVVTVRPFMGYGPTQPVNKLIPYVILCFLKENDPTLSNGLWVTDWVFIEDMVEGILAAAVTPGLEGETIDLGTGVLTSVKQIVETIKEIIQPVSNPYFGALPDRNAEHTRQADTDYTYSKINWKAKTTLYEGLKKTVQWYKTHHLHNQPKTIT